MKKKRKILIIGSSALIILLITAAVIWFSGFGTMIRLNNYINHESYVSDFDKYYQDFQTIANIALEHQDELLKSQFHSLGIGYDKGIGLFNMNNLKYIKLSKGEQQSLVRVYTAFKDAGGNLELIRVDKNRVSFEIDNDNFAVVNSLDGKKPTFVALPSEKNNYYYIQKLYKNWYSIKGRTK